MNASTAIISMLLTVAGYLIGSIPFGYLTAKWLKGIDIRAVGSGNIGATNVGRVLGFRFFLLVFTFDMAKGLLPTWWFPHWAGGHSVPELNVLVALATILGHNFPVYLKFKGGKGVATSLGALLALDPLAAGAAAFGFLVFLLVTRYVSLSSILAALVFCFIHFRGVTDPWSREERAMTLLTVSLMGMLLVRHRKNFARIGAGTEPKVSLRQPRERRPSGRVSAACLIVLAVVGGLAVGAVVVARQAARRDVLVIGRSSVTEVAYAGTGHQRAERVAFADNGRTLAVTCPRYNRLVLYRVTANESLTAGPDVELAGKPVAVCPARERIYVLERPPGDDRHVQPGWWETFDLQGQRIGDRVTVGFYPDDMALAPDGTHAYVLTSGRAEGSADRPSPALDVYPIDGAKSVGRVTFDDPSDDPSRLTLSASGQSAVVVLSGSDAAASVDLTDPSRPRLIGRAALPTLDQPYPSRGAGDVIVMPTISGREAVLFTLAGLGDCIAATLPHGSGLEFSQPARGQMLGTLTLRSGALGLGTVRPTGLAVARERGLIAVVNRSGGVHLVAIRPTTQSDQPRITAR